jgi:hypothetical protein
MAWAGHVARIGEIRNVHKIFTGKSEGKRPIGTPQRRWKANVRMGLRETGWEVVVWMGTSGGLFANTAMNLRVP